MSYLIGAPFIFSAFLISDLQLGATLYFVGVVCSLSGQLAGVFFTILVVHPINLHGLAKIQQTWNSEKTTMGSPSANQYGPTELTNSKFVI
jgi:hypothetical protein